MSRFELRPSRRWLPLLLALSIGLAVAVAAGCGGDDDSAAPAPPEPAAPAPAAEPPAPAPAEEPPPPPAEEPPAADLSPMEQTLAFIDDWQTRGRTPSQEWSIGYLAECVAQNPYCQTKWQGVQDAATLFGVNVKEFDPAFSPDEQSKQVEDAITEGFDGYVFAPTAVTPGCSFWMDMLEPTGAPVATEDLPMCGDNDYTEGTAGFTSAQSPSFFFDVADTAMGLCPDDPCKTVAMGGFLGSDLYGLFDGAVQAALPDHPNIDLIEETCACNFSAEEAFKFMQNMLSREPDIRLLISHWELMTRGAIEAIEQAGKVPGQDVIIINTGGTEIGLGDVRDGLTNGSFAILPYEEGFLAVAHVIRALEDGEFTPGWTNLAEHPKIVDGPGDIFITRENVDLFEPEY